MVWAADFRIRIVGLAVGAAVSCTSLHAQTTTPEEAAFRAALSRYVQTTQQQAMEIFVEARAKLSASELDRLSRLQVGTGLAFSGGIGSQCHVAGNIAYSAQVRSNVWEIWLCSEGLQAITDVSLASMLIWITSVAKRSNGRMDREAFNISQPEMAQIDGLSERAFQYYVHLYLRSLSSGIANRYTDGDRCLGDEVAYMLVHGDESTCSRSNPVKKRVGDARAWADAAFLLAAKEMFGMDPPPKPILDAPFEALRGAWFLGLVTYFVRHEMGHLVSPEAEVRQSFNAAALLRAEIAADHFATQDDPNENAYLAAIPIFVHRFWSVLEEVRDRSTGAGGMDTRARSLATVMCQQIKSAAKSDDQPMAQAARLFQDRVAC